MAVASAIAPLPAAAQFSGSQPGFAERPRAELVQFRDFFRFPFGDDRPRDRGFGNFSPYNPYTPPRPPQAVEATKPPSPRKVETQPTSVVLVIGDTFADWLAFGLEQTLADTPEIGIVRKIRPSSGLVRYDVRPDSPDWSQAVKDMLATEKPNAIVVMLGVNDRLPLRERAPSNKTSPQGQQIEKGASASPLQLIATYGAMAVFDGGLLQFLELVAWGYIALAFYVVFEGCRDGLLHRIHGARDWKERRPPRSRARKSNRGQFEPKISDFSWWVPLSRKLPGLRSRSRPDELMTSSAHVISTAWAARRPRAHAFRHPGLSDPASAP